MLFCGQLQIPHIQLFVTLIFAKAHYDLLVCWLYVIHLLMHPSMCWQALPWLLKTGLPPSCLLHPSMRQPLPMVAKSRSVSPWCRLLSRVELSHLPTLLLGTWIWRVCLSLWVSWCLCWSILVSVGITWSFWITRFRFLKCWCVLASSLERL